MRPLTGMCLALALIIPPATAESPPRPCRGLRVSSWCSLWIRCATITSMITAAPGRRACGVWSPRAPASAMRRTRISIRSRVPDTPRFDGDVPAFHGIILNQWWHRVEQKELACTDDPASPTSRTAQGSQAGGIARNGGSSRASRNARSRTGRPGARRDDLLKARSAIMLAGPAATPSHGSRAGISPRRRRSVQGGAICSNSSRARRRSSATSGRRRTGCCPVCVQVRG